MKNMAPAWALQNIRCSGIDYQLEVIASKIILKDKACELFCRLSVRKGFISASLRYALQQELVRNMIEFFQIFVTTII